MELFRKLRIRAGRSVLRGKLLKRDRKPRYINFFHVKTIGIVWDASSQEDFPVLTKFHQKMADLNKSVKIFGYYPGKELPDKLIANRIITCLKKGELDFLYRPYSPESQSFIKEMFDVLIDINFEKQFPLEFITTLSNASLKVGLAGSDPAGSPFDMMISLKEPVNIETYLGQVVYYLEMVNSENIKKAV